MNVNSSIEKMPKTITIQTLQDLCAELCEVMGEPTRCKDSRYIRKSGGFYYICKNLEGSPTQVSALMTGKEMFCYLQGAIQYGKLVKVE